MLSQLTGKPWLVIDPPAKAKHFTAASLALARHYSVEANATFVLWSNFGIATSVLYGPILFSAWVELKTRQAPGQTPMGGAPRGLGGVIPMPGAVAGGAPPAWPAGVQGTPKPPTPTPGALQ